MANLETLSQTFVVNAPAKTLWATISDFHNLKRWMPFITKSVAEVPGSNPGAMRTCSDENGAEMLDRLDAIDSKKMSMIYSILEANPPFPFRGYQATISLKEAGPNKTQIDWSCSFLRRGDAPVGEIKDHIKGVYQVSIDTLSKLHAA